MGGSFECNVVYSKNMKCSKYLTFFEIFYNFLNTLFYHYRASTCLAFGRD